MIKYSDPLIGEDSELEISDVSTAWYALKIANDTFFAIYYIGRASQEDVARMNLEKFKRQEALILPYMPPVMKRDELGNITYEKPTSLSMIPNPLPVTMPQRLKDAVAWLDEQFGVAQKRANADVAIERQPLSEILVKLEADVARWFVSEVEKGAAWLGGAKSAVLSGCVLKYDDGNVSFEYQEQEYD